MPYKFAKVISNNKERTVHDLNPYSSIDFNLMLLKTKYLPINYLAKSEHNNYIYGICK